MIVKRIEEQEQKSAGGIISPGTAKEKPQEGKVMAVGPGKTEDGKVLTWRRATGYCSASPPAPRSSSTARSA